jgi:hypothetical protein
VRQAKEDIWNKSEPGDIQELHLEQGKPGQESKVVALSHQVGILKKTV